MTPKSFDIRDYLEAKFASLGEKLDNIEVQVNRTNGRVNQHDKNIIKLNELTRFIPGIAIAVGMIVLYLVAVGIIPPNFFN